MNIEAKISRQLDMFRINGLLMDLLDPRGLTYDSVAARDLVMDLPSTRGIKFEHFKMPMLEMKDDHVIVVKQESGKLRNAVDEWQVRHDRYSMDYMGDSEDVMGTLHISSLDSDGKTPLRHTLHYLANTYGHGSIHLGPMTTQEPPMLMPWLPEAFWPVRGRRLPSNNGMLPLKQVVASPAL